MKARIIHHPIYVDGSLDGQGNTMCGGIFRNASVLSKYLDIVTCPYCKWEWYKENGHRLANRPPAGSPEVHWRAQLYNNDWVAVCGTLDSKNYHILASKKSIEVNCSACRNVLENEND
jgi:uncharacterized protein YbaR (Trm112 family)